MLVFYGRTDSVSAHVRGEQMAEYLGVPYNPSTPIDGATVICVREVHVGRSVIDRAKYWYYDPGDDVQLFEAAARCLNSYSMGLIAPTNRAVALYGDTNHEVVVIPDFHCNFESVVRPVDRDVKTVGYVGSAVGFDYNFGIVHWKLNDAGFDFKICVVDAPEDNNRKRVCDFIESCDIMITHRKHVQGWRWPDVLMPQLKLINAGAFKVPIVSYPLPAYTYLGLNGCFLPVDGVEGIVKGCVALRDNSNLYKTIVERAYEHAKDYHISEIAKLYRAIDRG